MKTALWISAHAHWRSFQCVELRQQPEKHVLWLAPGLQAHTLDPSDKAEFQQKFK